MRGNFLSISIDLRSDDAISASLEVLTVLQIPYNEIVFGISQLHPGLIVVSTRFDEMPTLTDHI